MKMLVMGLNCPIVDEDNKCDMKRLIIDYLCSNMHNNHFYAYRFFFCEVLNFINVVGQIFFMDMFLGLLVLIIKLRNLISNLRFLIVLIG